MKRPTGRRGGLSDVGGVVRFRADGRRATDEERPCPEPVQGVNRLGRAGVIEIIGNALAVAGIFSLGALLSYARIWLVSYRGGDE